MLNIKDLILDTLLGEKKYISIQYDDETQDLLRHWALQNKFNLSLAHDKLTKQSPDDFIFHTTLAFSTSRHSNIMNCILPLDDVEARISGYKYLGIDNDIPVLLIDSPMIIAMKNRLNDMGVKDTYPIYIPHVSISYDVNSGRPLNEVKLPNFVLKSKYLIVKRNEI